MANTLAFAEEPDATCVPALNAARKWRSGGEGRVPVSTRPLTWRSLDEVPADWGPSTVAIGVFDGVHRGHRSLVTRAGTVARERDVAACVVTFDPHPLAVLRPDAAPQAISTVPHRIALLGELGADAVLVLPFTAELAAWSAQGFVERVLVDALGAVHVVVGEDFRFGARAAGDPALLRKLGESSGFTVEEVALLRDGASRISSTVVRQLVGTGDVEGAAVLLTRPHRLEGAVVTGDRRGRQLGYPTANLDLPPEAAVPADGVYAGWLLHAGRRMPAAISIGTNPTFDGCARRVEAYVLDRTDLELYGEHVAVDFATRLRDTWRFDSVEELVAQMRRDVDAARALLAVLDAPGW